MSSITIADLDNAKLDVQHISEVATSLAPRAVDRLGHSKDTLKSAIDGIKAFNARGIWAASTAYAVKDLVSVTGTWYACVDAHTSGSSFVNDSASFWRIHQGLTKAEIAATNGARQIGYGASTLGDVLDTIRADPLKVLPSTYAEPRSRLIVGQEYLWAFHRRFIDLGGLAETPFKIVWSGDSTTAGDGAAGFTVDSISKNWAVRYGVTNIENINSGHSGYSLMSWEASGGWLDQDIAAYPTMSVYIVRWGLNDGSSWSHDLIALETRLRSGMARLRTWRNAKSLSIILMTPNCASDTGFRDEAWLEGVSEIFKRVAREYQCCFIDTYAMWRDARGVAVGAWLDDPYGTHDIGIHPDQALNHCIIDAVAEILYRPISVGPSVRNLFSNTASGASHITAGTPGNAEAFNYGISIYRTDSPLTFPFTGSVITTRTADGLVKQELIGYDSDQDKRSIVRYALGGMSWSEWRGLALNMGLLNGWTTYGSTDRLFYYKSPDGTVSIEGRVKNASSAVSTIGLLPVGFRPFQNMRFLAHSYDGTTLGTVQVGVDGGVVFANGSNEDLHIRCSFKAFQ